MLLSAHGDFSSQSVSEEVHRATSNSKCGQASARLRLPQGILFLFLWPIRNQTCMIGPGELQLRAESVSQPSCCTVLSRLRHFLLADKNAQGPTNCLTCSSASRHLDLLTPIDATRIRSHASNWSWSAGCVHGKLPDTPPTCSSRRHVPRKYTMYVARKPHHLNTRKAKKSSASSRNVSRCSSTRASGRHSTTLR